MADRAVLFDLDGTLLDTLDDLADSMNAVLEAEGLPPHPVDAYRYFVGEGVETLVRRALPGGTHDGVVVERCVRAMRNEYAARMMNRTRPYKGVEALLDGLERWGVPKAVLSNKPDDSVRLLVNDLLGRWSFAAVRGAGAGFARKPDPAGALDIARALGVPPAEFVSLGDSGTDMRTARAAGMYPVGALWGFRGEAELRENGAQQVIAAPQELLSILNLR
jgi:phosphoglycolate phosphatase